MSKQRFLGGLLGANPLRNVAGDANWSDVTLLLDGDNNLTDRSGNTSMAWSGSASYNSGGKHGAALSFGASGTHVQGPTGANTSSFQFGTDPFTIETWIYLNATPAGDDFIFCPRGSYLDTSSFVWFVRASGSNAQLTMYSYNSYWYVSSSTFAPQTWTHIAVTRDTNKHFKFYINGQLIDTVTNQTTRVMGHTSTAPIRIGNGENGTQGLNGLLDDFRVTKGVARDIAADWTAGVYNTPLPQGAETGFTDPTSVPVDFTVDTDHVESYETVATLIMQSVYGFKDDGTHVMWFDYAGTPNMGDAQLTTPYDLSTATGVTKDTGNGVASTNQFGGYVSRDGTRILAADYLSGDIDQWTLSTAWDVSTASSSPTVYALGTNKSTTVRAFTMKDDGTRIYWADGGSPYVGFNQADLSTAWDLTTTGSVTSIAAGTFASGLTPSFISRYMSFNPDGTHLFFHSENDVIYDFVLNTPWDLSAGAASYQMYTDDGTSGDIRGLWATADDLHYYSRDLNSGNGGNVQKPYGLTPGTVARTTSNVGVVALDEAGPETNEGTAVAGDEYWDDVTLLLDGSSTTDLSSASPTVTPSASGLTSGNSGGKYGQYIDFQDSGYINVALPSAIGAVSGGAAEAFTVECWAYFDSLSADGLFQLLPSPNILGGSDDTNASTLAVAVGSNKWLVYYDGGQTGNIGTTISTNTWYHVALVFDGTDLVFYVDGSALQTYSNHAANLQTNGYENIAIGGYYSTGYVMDGRIEDFRITKGVARYTGTFTPPTEALPQGAPVAAKQLTQLNWGGIRGRDVVTSTAGGGTTASIDYLVVGGGGGGGKGKLGAYMEWGGGGGAGGYLTSWAGAGNNETSGGGATVGNAVTKSSGDQFTVIVGNGGAGSSTTATKGTSGSNSQFDSVIAYGGGGGGYGDGLAGGSGGGSASPTTPMYAGYGPTSYAGGTATPAGQGNAGGGSSDEGRSGGGGGAGSAGTVTSVNYQGGAGGAGLASTITGASVVRAGGGGGASYQDPAGVGGSGGGGYGSRSNNTGSTPTSAATDGTANTGSGGGGDSHYHSNNTGGDGGSGVVILRMPTSVTLTSSSITVPAPQTVGTDEHYYEFTSGSGTVAVNIAEGSNSLANTGILSLSEMLQVSYGLGASIDVLVVGGGSGQGGHNDNTYYVAGGNAGDVVRRTAYDVTLGSPIAIAIGAGSASGADGQNIATDSPQGGQTSFGSLTADGGHGSPGNLSLANTATYDNTTTVDIDGTITNYSMGTWAGSFNAVGGSGAGGDGSGTAGSSSGGAGYDYVVNGTTVDTVAQGGDWLTSSTGTNHAATEYGSGGQGGFDSEAFGIDGVVYVAYPTGTVSSYTWSGSAGDLDVDTATVSGYTILRFTGDGNWTPTAA
jgi:hypothetical protein